MDRTGEQQEEGNDMVQACLQGRMPHISMTVTCAKTSAVPYTPQNQGRPQASEGEQPYAKPCSVNNGEAQDRAINSAADPSCVRVKYANPRAGSASSPDPGSVSGTAFA